MRLIKFATIKSCFSKKIRKSVSEAVSFFFFLTDDRSSWRSPGLEIQSICSAMTLPKTTTSRRLLAPRRLAPLTDAHAVSPAAQRPSIGLSSSFSRVNTWQSVIYVEKCNYGVNHIITSLWTPIIANYLCCYLRKPYWSINNRVRAFTFVNKTLKYIGDSKTIDMINTNILVWLII